MGTWCWSKRGCKIADDYRSVTLTAPENKSGDFVEVHMLFPQTLTHANTNVKNEKAFDRIVAEEEKLINDEKALKSTGFFGMIVGWVLLVLNMVLCLCDRVLREP